MQTPPRVKGHTFDSRSVPGKQSIYTCELTEQNVLLTFFMGADRLSLSSKYVVDIIMTEKSSN